MLLSLVLFSHLQSLQFNDRKEVLHLMKCVVVEAAPSNLGQTLLMNLGIDQ
jgi:hypothetical protein